MVCDVSSDFLLWPFVQDYLGYFGIVKMCKHGNNIFVLACGFLGLFFKPGAADWLLF